MTLLNAKKIRKGKTQTRKKLKFLILRGWFKIFFSLSTSSSLKMETPRKKTSIEGTPDTVEKLKKKKKELDVKSIDAVLQWWLDDSPDTSARVCDKEGEEEVQEGEQKKRKINTQEKLVSLEILTERPGALEYYTGFGRAEVDWLIRQFREVDSFQFFFCFVWSKMGG